MSTPTTVRLRILDNDYQVACPPEEQEGLLKAGRYLDDKMRAIRSSGNVIGTERIAHGGKAYASHDAQIYLSRLHQMPDVLKQQG